MLASYEEGRSLNQIVMSSQLSSSILDAPFSQDLLLYLGFNFQKDGAKDKDPFVVFPHWDYESTLKTSAVILDAAYCKYLDVTSCLAQNRMFFLYHYLEQIMSLITVIRIFVAIFEVSGLSGHLMGRLMKTLTHNNMGKMKELVSMGCFKSSNSSYPPPPPLLISDQCFVWCPS